ncbi:hypothetical protein BT96DRAFT_927099 [Gymnopus androsaceus JB14]|uniref:Uncharacterized protein n=1 Tax=Gymnopus androsaceus JB14 TaxID=1447944 RepID=A0A6A4GRM0_9AGAR|nr:hypothetical protein BT96DRAFT_927099 [Gymnopus androsaceus JB14]
MLKYNGSKELFLSSNLRTLHFNINIGDAFGKSLTNEFDPTELLECWTRSLALSMPFSRLRVVEIDICASPANLKNFDYTTCSGWSKLDSLLNDQATLTPEFEFKLSANSAIMIPDYYDSRRSGSFSEEMLAALEAVFPLMGARYAAETEKKKKKNDKGWYPPFVRPTSRSLERYMNVESAGFY